MASGADAPLGAMGLAPSSFFGSHFPRLDDKGRFFLPARFRDALAAGLIIAKHQDRCLAIRTKPGFERMSGHDWLASYGDAETLALALDRMAEFRLRRPNPLAGSGAELLREYAGLDKELAVLGNGSVIEVWDADRWKAYEAEVEESFANQSQEVFPGRF